MANRGLKVFDSGGDVVLDLSDSITRIIGTVTTGTQNGSIYNPGLVEGPPFVAVISPQDAVNYFMPAFSFSGTTMSWSFDGYSSSSLFQGKASVTALYGVYT